MLAAGHGDFPVERHAGVGDGLQDQVADQRGAGIDPLVRAEPLDHALDDPGQVQREAVGGLGALEFPEGRCQRGVKTLQFLAQAAGEQRFVEAFGQGHGERGGGVPARGVAIR